MSYWINKKNKKIYKAITTAKNASNKNDYELMMLYKDVETGEQYVREFNEFTNKFEVCHLMNFYQNEIDMNTKIIEKDAE